MFHPGGHRSLFFKWAPIWVLCCLALYACTAVVPHPPTSKAPPPTQPGQPKPYRVEGKWYQPLAHSKGFSQRGIASWYGKKFHGRKTSNGEIYDMYGRSAAHKTLPMGTVVRVKNLDNGRTLNVRINDRGPFVRGRIIDLSYGAAKQIGMVQSGTAQVEIVALGAEAGITSEGKQTYRPLDYYSGNFTFQVGAFKERKNAETLRAKLDRIYKNAHITIFDTAEGSFYRVRVGRCETLQEAESYEQVLSRNGFPDAFIVAE